MSLFDIFERLEMTFIGEAIRNSLWLFPVIEAFHLIGFALLGGMVVVTDLRLVGICLRNRSIAEVSRGTRPYMYLALLIIFATGIPLALSEMIKLYYNFSFWVKMSSLLAALIFMFAVRNPISVREELPQYIYIFCGLVSLSLWFTVAAAGRWIGFS